MLELVLALPILLFIMALIIDYGTVAAWKVREHSVARLAVWETRWPRSGSTDPRPSYWPATASMESSDQGTVAAMDDSRVDLPVARGPLPAANVNSDLLDPTRGLREGSAELTRSYALLGKMGTYTFKAQTWLIDDKWQYQQMGMGDQLAAANPRVVRAGQGPRVAGEFLRAVGDGDCPAPFRTQLAPLDDDPDFIYYGAFRLGRRSRFPSAVPADVYDRSHLTDQSVQQSHRSHSRQSRNGGGFPAWRRRWPSFLGLYHRALTAFSDCQAEETAGAPDGLAGPVADPAIAGQDRSGLQTVPPNDSGEQWRDS